MLVKQRNRLLQLAFTHVPIAIHKEKIFPRFPLARSRLDFCHVDSIPPKRSQRAIQGADLIDDAEHQARPVLAGWRTALPSQYQEARGVGGIILNIMFEDAQGIFLSRQDPGNRGGVFLSRRKLSRTRVGGCLDDLRSRQVVLQDPGKQWSSTSPARGHWT